METLGSVAARTVAVAARTNAIGLKTDSIAAKTEAIEQRLEAVAASVNDYHAAIAARFQELERQLGDLREQVIEEGEKTRACLFPAPSPVPQT